MSNLERPVAVEAWAMGHGEQVQRSMELDLLVHSDMP